MADYNGDGIPDLVVGTNETVGNQGSTGFFYIVDGRGNNAPGGLPAELAPARSRRSTTLPIVGQGDQLVHAVAVDLNVDGTPDVFLQGNAQPPLVLPANPGPPRTGATSRQPSLPLVGRGRTGRPSGFSGSTAAAFGDLLNAKPDEIIPVFSHPSVGDLDQDGVPDVIMSGGSLSLALNMEGSTTKPFQQLVGMWSGKTGKMMRGSPFVVEDYSFLTNQVIADITGDNYPEVIQGTDGYFVHAVDACGREATNWPKFTGGWMTATPAVGDINGDHSLAVVEATRDGYLYAWGTKGKDSGVVQWESFHHDNANTGNYATKLDQGVLELAPTPIDCDAVVKPDAGTGMMPGTPDGGKPPVMTPDAGAGSPPADVHAARRDALGRRRLRLHGRDEGARDGGLAHARPHRAPRGSQASAGWRGHGGEAMNRAWRHLGLAGPAATGVFLLLATGGCSADIDATCGGLCVAVDGASGDDRSLGDASRDGGGGTAHPDGSTIGHTDAMQPHGRLRRYRRGCRHGRGRTGRRAGQRRAPCRGRSPDLCRLGADHGAHGHGPLAHVRRADAVDRGRSHVLRVHAAQPNGTAYDAKVTAQPSNPQEGCQFSGSHA